jgi:tyrosine-protein kinase Etk/Wzc
VFKTKRNPGLVDYLFGQVTLEEIIRVSKINDLHYITSGTIPPNPAEMLESSAMKEFLREIKSRYELILVDSPPIIAVTDAEILSRMVDATILVVAAESTELELMEKSVELLRGENNSFIGTVLNNFSYKAGYGSYYKKYYYAHPSN